MVALTLAFVHTQPGRDVIANIVESKLNGVIAGEVQIGHLSSLSLFEVTLEDVVLLDSDGRPTAEIESVSADWDLFSLIRGDVDIVRVAVENPRVGLWLEPDGRFSLLSAIASSSDTSELTPSSEEPGEPTSIRFRYISIQGGELHTDDPRARGLAISGLEILASLEIDPDVVVDLVHLSAHVEDSEQELLDFWLPNATIETAQGVTVVAELAIASADDSVRISGSLEFAPGEEPRIEAHLALHPMTGFLLGPLGFADHQAVVPAWVRGHIDVNGTLAELDVQAELDTPGGLVALGALLTDLEDVRLTSQSTGLALREVSSMLPEHDVGWELTAAVDTNENGQRNIDLELTSATFDESEIPAVTLNALLTDEAITVERIFLPHLGDKLEISGAFHFGGSVDFDVRIDQLDLGTESRLEPLLRGTTGVVDASLRGHLDPNELTVAADVILSVEDLDGPGFGVDQLDISGFANGALFSPEVDLQIQIERLSAGDNGVESASVHLVGPVGQYALNGEVRLDDGPLIGPAVQAQVQRRVAGRAVVLRIAVGTIAVAAAEGFGLVGAAHRPASASSARTARRILARRWRTVSGLLPKWRPICRNVRRWSRMSAPVRSIVESPSSISCVEHTCRAGRADRASMKSLSPGDAAPVSRSVNSVLLRLRRWRRISPRISFSMSRQPWQ